MHFIMIIIIFKKNKLMNLSVYLSLVSIGDRQTVSDAGVAMPRSLMKCPLNNHNGYILLSLRYSYTCLFIAAS